MATCFLTACQTISPTTIHHSQNSPNNPQKNNEKWVFIVKNPSDNTSSIMMTDSMGNHLTTLLTVTGNLFGLSASVDKKHLIYTYQQKNNFAKVYQLNLTNQHSKALLDERVNYFGASLSPNNQSLLFSANYYGINEDPDIWLKNLQNNDSHIVIKQKGIDISPQWLPNAQSFIFVSDKDSSQPRLYQYDLLSKKSKPIGKQQYEANARISPKADKITFLTKQNQHFVNVLMDLTTGQSITIRDDEQADFVNFSPKGDFLIYPLAGSIVTLPLPDFNQYTNEPMLQKQVVAIKGLPTNAKISEVIWLVGEGDNVR